MTLFELDEAANRIREEVDPDANIIVGSTLDTELEGKMRVSVVATGIEAEESLRASNEHFGETSFLKAKEVSEETDQNLSIEEPIVAKTQQIFDDVDNEIFSNRESDQAQMLEKQNSETVSEIEDSFITQTHSSAVTPSQETMARLRAAVTNEPNELNTTEAIDQKIENERPKFGIGSLISRMSRSEPVKPASGISRNDPNLETNSVEERDLEDLKQEKIEVPAFLRRQAN